MGVKWRFLTNQTDFALTCCIIMNTLFFVLVLFSISTTDDITATLCSNKTAVLLVVMWYLDLMLLMPSFLVQVSLIVV